MALSNAERQRRYRERLKAQALQTPEAVALAVREAVETLAAAWDDIQPEEQPWAKYIAQSGIEELAQLCRDEGLADTDQQRDAIRRVRLILDALSLRN